MLRYDHKDCTRKLKMYTVTFVLSETPQCQRPILSSSPYVLTEIMRQKGSRHDAVTCVYSAKSKLFLNVLSSCLSYWRWVHRKKPRSTGKDRRGLKEHGETLLAFIRETKRKQGDGKQIHAEGRSS